MGFAISRIITGAASIEAPKALMCRRLAAITDCALVILLLAGVGAVCGLQLDYWKIVAIAGGSAAGVLLAADLLTIVFVRCCGQPRREGFWPNSPLPPSKGQFESVEEEGYSLPVHQEVVLCAETLQRAASDCISPLKPILDDNPTLEDAKEAVRVWLSLSDKCLREYGCAPLNGNTHKQKLEAFLKVESLESSWAQAYQAYYSDFQQTLLCHLSRPLDDIFQRLLKLYGLCNDVSFKKPSYNLNFVADILSTGSGVLVTVDEKGEELSREKYVVTLPDTTHIDLSDIPLRGLNGSLENLLSDGPQACLADEYTIYFSPKWKHFYATAEEIFKLVADRPSLKQGILRFACIIVYTENEGNASCMPRIALSCRNRDEANNALACLFEHFRNYARHWGSNNFMPFTCRGKNPLISYEQSNHAYKESLSRTNPKIFAGMYSEDGVYFNKQFGNYQLEKPTDF